jgi:DNA-binding CsgD family transcriptional regulator
VTGDRLIRASTAAVVTFVAAVAAVVSYSHIYDLGRAHGQSGTAARLLPLSVDGLILAASLVLLHEARNRRPAPALARGMLGLGVAATVAANVAYGAGFGWPGALISAWPAVAFIGAVEMALGLVRRARVATERPVATATHARPKRVATRRPSAADTEAAILATLASGQDMTNEQLARAVGVSTRTARRYRTRLTATANGHPSE